MPKRTMTVALVVSAGILAGAASANPQSDDTRLEKLTVVDEGSLDLRKILWLGLEAGGVYTEPYDDEIEVAKQGYNLGIKTHFSASTPQVTFELGVGWVQSRIEALGDVAPPADPADPAAPPYDDAEEVDTDFGIAEASARWRLSRFFEFGPVVATTFGVDTSFGPLEDPSTGHTPNVFIGAAMAILTNDPNYQNRFVQRFIAQVLTDLTIRERQVFLINLQLDFGILLGSKAKVVVKEKVRTEVKTEIQYDTIVEHEVQVVEKVKESYVIDAGVINFETGRAEIPQSTAAFLGELAQFLMGRADDWSQIRLSGHADKRGNEESNRELSNRRVAAVAGILTSQGVPRERINEQALAASTPVDETDSSVSLARNRRVEILIVGGENTPSLKEAILRLQQKYQQPSTCQSAQCR